MSAFRRALQWILFVSTLLILLSTLSAQSTQPAADNPPAEQTYNPIPQRLIWPGIAVIVLIGIFVTAALAGPLIRANKDEQEDTSDKNAD